jgi:hypothetical protein
MSVEFYTKPYFKGITFSFDIGNHNNVKKLNIQSMIINDNVEVLIKYKNNTKTFCGPQIKQVLSINNIENINIKHSICNPYTDKNSILNRYSIGKNYQIQINNNLQPISTEENIKNGLIDFWYNNQNNRHNNYYKVYNTSTSDLHDYSINNKWFNDQQQFINHNHNAIYNHTKEKYPLIDTNNVSNCHFECGRTSKTFRRNLCTLKCDPNYKVNDRTENNMTKTTKCHDDADNISYGYSKSNDTIKHIQKIKNNKKKKKEKTKTIKQDIQYPRPIPEVWNINTSYLDFFEPNLNEHFSSINNKYKQYHMYPTNNKNTDEALVELYSGPNYTYNYIKLSEGTHQLTKYNTIQSIKIKNNVTVTFYTKDKELTVNGPVNDPDFNLSTDIQFICIKKKKIIEGFQKNKNIYLIIIIILFLTYKENIFCI